MQQERHGRDNEYEIAFESLTFLCESTQINVVM